jgi:hypothetical protein
MEKLARITVVEIDRRQGDDLRLAALHNIPRCAACSRLNCLMDAHDELGPPIKLSQLIQFLPPVPLGCTTLFCAPLTARYAEED